MLEISIVLYFMGYNGKSIFCMWTNKKTIMFIQQNLLNFYYVYHFMIHKSMGIESCEIMILSFKSLHQIRRDKEQ